MSVSPHDGHNRSSKIILAIKSANGLEIVKGRTTNCAGIHLHKTIFRSIYRKPSLTGYFLCERHQTRLVAMEYKGFVIRAFERELGKWRAAVRRPHGIPLKSQGPKKTVLLRYLSGCSHCNGRSRACY
jgi:hypothetical protein